MPRHGLIRTHSALTYANAILGGDTRPIVLHDDTKPFAGCETAINRGAQAHYPAAPLAPVVEHIAEQLRQIATITDELTRGFNHEFDGQVLACVDLQKGHPQLSDNRRNI